MCARGRAERGQTLPFFAIVIVAILGLVGLAIDGARLYAEHARLQGAADAAAIGAAHELRRGNRDYGRNILPAAIQGAGLHGVSESDAEIIVHHPPISGAFSQSEEHVEVVLRGTVQNTFMGIFGVTERAVSSRAVAGLAEAETACIMVLTDGAYTVEGEQPFDIDCAVEARGATDPFAGLPAPDCVGRPAGAAQSDETTGETLYWPGCYDEPVAVRSGRVRFMPGTHVFRQGLELAAGEAQGDGVSFVFPSSNGQTGVTLRPAARVALAAPKRGELSGVLFYGAAGQAALDRGEGSELEGALYFPAGELRWTPNAPGSAAWTRAVAARVTVLEAPGGRALTSSRGEGPAGLLAVLVE